MELDPEPEHLILRTDLERFLFDLMGMELLEAEYRLLRTHLERFLFDLMGKVVLG